MEVNVYMNISLIKNTGSFVGRMELTLSRFEQCKKDIEELRDINANLLDSFL